MRNMGREDLFERWLKEVVRAAGPYDDTETFAHFSERIKAEEKTVSDTVHGDAETLPASEKRDEPPSDSDKIQAPPTERPGRQNQRDGRSQLMDEEADANASHRGTD